MKPTTKKILIGAGIGLAIVSYLAYEKINKIKEIFAQIDIVPKAVRNLKISFSSISFLTDVLLVNRSNEALSVQGYFANLKRLNFFYSGKYIGTAKPVVSEIEIPVNNELLFKNIPVELPASTILTNIVELSSFDFNKLTVEAVIEVAGKEFYIK